MLTSASVTANIPAADLARARSFYADTLGLTPASEVGDGGMLIYRTDGGTMFSVYQTEYAGQAGHTIAQFHVDDVVAEARALQAKGVALETYDMPGVEWDDGVADMGGMGKAAWFKDSEGNTLCLDSGFPASRLSHRGLSHDRSARSSALLIVAGQSSGFGTVSISDRDDIASTRRWNCCRAASIFFASTAAGHDCACASTRS